MTLIWKDPPTPKRQTMKWDLVALELQEHPGQWALVRENSSCGITPALQRRGLEVRHVSKGNNLHDIYARWPEVTS